MPVLQKRRKMRIYGFLYVFVFSLFFVQTCYAEQVTTRELSEGFWELYTILRITSLFVGAISVAICGYHMLTGNASDFEKYKKIAILSVLAVGTIWALPAVMNMAKKIGLAHKWDPNNPGF